MLYGRAGPARDSDMTSQYFLNANAGATESATDNGVENPLHWLPGGRIAGELTQPLGILERWKEERKSKQDEGLTEPLGGTGH